MLGTVETIASLVDGTAKESPIVVSAMVILEASAIPLPKKFKKKVGSILKGITSKVNGMKKKLDDKLGRKKNVNKDVEKANSISAAVCNMRGKRSITDNDISLMLPKSMKEMKNIMVEQFADIRPIEEIVGEMFGYVLLLEMIKRSDKRATPFIMRTCEEYRSGRRQATCHFELTSAIKKVCC